MGAVCPAALAHGAVNLDVGDHQVVHVEALDLRGTMPEGDRSDGGSKPTTETWQMLNSQVQLGRTREA